jgi:hypothetical protein
MYHHVDFFNLQLRSRLPQHLYFWEYGPFLAGNALLGNFMLQKADFKPLTIPFIR